MGSKKKKSKKKRTIKDDFSEENKEEEVIKVYEKSRLARLTYPQTIGEIQELYPGYVLSKLYQFTTKFGAANGKGRMWTVYSKYYFIIYIDEKNSFKMESEKSFHLTRIDIWASEQLDGYKEKNFENIYYNKTFILPDEAMVFLMELDKPSVLEIINKFGMRIRH